MTKRKNFDFTYYCLNCGKEYRTNKIFPYGWICSKCIHKKKLNLNCSVCGKEITLSWDHYIHSHFNTFWLCKKCMSEYKSMINKYIWNSKTDEEKEKHGEYSKLQWYGLSYEERLAKMQYCFNGRDKYYFNITDYEKFVDFEYKKVISFNNNAENHITSNILELKFIEILNKYNIEYICQYSNILVDPNIFKIFPINPYSKFGYTNPFHTWDFFIKTKLKNILIDIDGSYHNLNHNKLELTNRKIDMINRQRMYDIRRPYQTDGLESYIIICYKNNDFINTNIFDIRKNGNIRFVDLIKRLRIYNGETNDPLIKLLIANKNKLK